MIPPRIQKALADINELLAAMNTCHVCQGTLHLEDSEPVHCENCSACCEDHDEPDCTPISRLHENASRAISQLEKALKKGCK